MNAPPLPQQNPPPETHSPASAAPTEATYLMSNSPLRDRRSSNTTDNYRPRIISTVGQRPACLVSASVTYVGNNEIYAFGGFDQYTDEVYNHVLRLNLETRQWNLVDNYGDIPGVRMGHTATLWQGGKVLIFGGENEHRAYLNDLIVFDLKTAHWTQPDIRGAPPQGRARHSAVIHEDKLFIIGGLSGRDNSTILDDFCYLDLKKWEWSRPWRFVPRFGHTSWVWNGRIWVFGGLTEGMECANDIWWLDMKRSPCFEPSTAFESFERRSSTPRPTRPSNTLSGMHSSGNSGYAANSSSVQVNQSSIHGARKPPMAPGSISSLNFVSGPHIPSQSTGNHFHVFSSGCLLDFITPGPAATASLETSLCALELETMRWERLAEGTDLFNPNYCWHYCAINQDGTHAWLLGCPEQQANQGTGGEYLSDVLPIDLRKLGLLGNNLASDQHLDHSRAPTSDTLPTSHLFGIGADLAKMFDKAPGVGGSSTDFMVTAESTDELAVVDGTDDMSAASAQTSHPIHVHKLILEARWPHFARMIAAQMAEFHSSKLHIPEPYSVVRAFLHYLYTDSITPDPADGAPDLDDVAGMLVMSNCYDMPRLRLLCRNRLSRELDVEHAAIIWERAGNANEDWLRRRAARFCLTFWGRVVRTPGFLGLKQSAMAELCQEIDSEGRVVGADELEFVGGLAGARFGGTYGHRESRSHRSSTAGFATGDDMDDFDEEEGMELS